MRILNDVLVGASVVVFAVILALVMIGRANANLELELEMEKELDSYENN